MLALLVLVCTGMSCAQPDTVELYQKSGKAEYGAYSFNLELADSLAPYDIWFYTRTVDHSIQNLRLDIVWTSPSGAGFTETVYMEAVTPEGSRTLYRSGVVPAENGSWSLKLRPREESRNCSDRLCGFGIIYKRNN